MKGYKKWSVFTLIVGMAMMCSSCVVHRHSRSHRHHSHLHRAVILAEQTAATEQSKDCNTFDECLAMNESDSYGSAE